MNQLTIQNVKASFNGMNVDHATYMNVFTKEMREMWNRNQVQNYVILASVLLFWKHDRDITYLNHGMQYARAISGMRVNAVKAFFIAFTGASGSGTEFKFTKGKSKMRALPEDFMKLKKWTEWADEKAPEPDYNKEKFVGDLVKMLERKADKAAENQDWETETRIRKMILVA